VPADLAVCINCGTGIADARRLPPVGDPRWCPYCGRLAVVEHGTQGTRYYVTLVLLTLLFIVPGVIYYVRSRRQRWCTSCRLRISGPPLTSAHYG